MSLAEVQTESTNNMSSLPTSHLNQATSGLKAPLALVVVHAVLFILSFVILFPLATIALRLEWAHSFRTHWITQCVAVILSFVAFAIAIAQSVQSKAYSSFDEAHQILGIIVTACLLIQVFLGFRHHIIFKAIRSRTWFSYTHMVFGRVVIYAGMVNAVL